MRLTVIVAILALAGCYRSYDRSSVNAECGNGVVEPGEECDGDPGPCTGADSCPGFRWCGEDCTWDECVTGGFGVLSGPVRLTDEPSLQAVIRTQAIWTGSRYGVFWTGTRAASPMTIDPWFAAVSTASAVVVPAHESLAITENTVEIDAAWRPADARFGIVVTTPSAERGVLLNITDPDGWVLIDPGVAAPTPESTDVVMAASLETFGVMWRNVETQRVWFAAVTPDIGIVSPVLLDELSTMPYHRLPAIAAYDGGYAVTWHVDDPAVGESALRFARLDNDAGLMSGIVSLFEDMGVQPPSGLVLADTGYGIVFSTQPYFDSPVLDLFVALVNEDGRVLAGPVDAGRTRRNENRDADLAWSGTELGVVLATPLEEEPGAQRALAFSRFTPEGLEIGEEFRLTLDGDAGKPTVSWDGEGYGVAYTLEADEEVDVEFVRLGCIPPD